MFLAPNTSFILTICLYLVWNQKFLLCFIEWFERGNRNNKLHHQCFCDSKFGVSIPRNNTMSILCMFCCCLFVCFRQTHHTIIYINTLTCVIILLNQTHNDENLKFSFALDCQVVFNEVFSSLFGTVFWLCELSIWPTYWNQQQRKEFK